MVYDPVNCPCDGCKRSALTEDDIEWIEAHGGQRPSIMDTVCEIAVDALIDKRWG